MMYFAYKLNKQDDNIQPWCTPFLIWNQSVVPCPVPTVASWPAYRFLRRQVRWSAIPISLRIFQFVVIHTTKGFSVVNEADVLLEFSCFFYDPNMLKDDAVKVLHSVCQKIWETHQWPQDWKRSVYIPIPKKGNTKNCSNYLTMALISHTSNVMLKILQARLQ